MTPEQRDRYQWNLRPQAPQRPAGFGAWPGGARLAVQLIMLHEWESTPRPQRRNKRP